MTAEQMDLEIKKYSLEYQKHYDDLRHKFIKEDHMKYQRWFWTGVVILGVSAQIIAYLSK